jgi:diguanylate cyclase
MKQTDQTLLEQMRITDFEIDNRKSLFTLTDDDVAALVNARPKIEPRLDALVKDFYEMQTSIAEIALLIGDADTLGRLRSAQGKYITDLFSGVYDIEYVNNRLRIGMVHKRIGVEPKLYLAAIHSLKSMLSELIREVLSDQEEVHHTQSALTKLFMFDIALVFETYIRSLVSEIETSKDKSEEYAHSLEIKVQERTKQLEEMTRIDPLTGLWNKRYLDETITRVLRAAERRSEPVTLVYIDVDDFKIINDTQGHQKGDEVLRSIATLIKQISRKEDSCFRFGGDEFCLILPNCTDVQARQVYMERLNQQLPAVMKGLSLSVGVIQTGPDTYMDLDQLIRSADENMYSMKRGDAQISTIPAQK